MEFHSFRSEITVPRFTRPLVTTAAAVAAAGFVVLGGAGVASADPTPGYPGGYPGGGYPGGYTGGGGPSGGITTTNPKPGGPVSVTASCTSGAGATLTFDGTTIATAPVSNGTAVLTGTVPAGATGAHSVVATCDNGARYPFTVTVQSASGPSGALASTGAKVASITVGGIVFVVAGTGLVFLSRRRRGTVA